MSTAAAAAAAKEAAATADVRLLWTLAVQQAAASVNGVLRQRNPLFEVSICLSQGCTF
jgi:hypothetical protein